MSLSSGPGVAGRAGTGQWGIVGCCDESNGELRSEEQIREGFTEGAASGLILQGRIHRSLPATQDGGREDLGWRTRGNSGRWRGARWQMGLAGARLVQQPLLRSCLHPSVIHSTRLSPRPVLGRERGQGARPAPCFLRVPTTRFFPSMACS